MSESNAARPSGARAPARYFCPCPRGLEQVLARELAALGAADAAPRPGGVAWQGGRDECYRANLWSRIASRVLREVGRAPYRDADDIYRAALALPWPEWFDPDRTIRVDVVASRSPLESVDFAVLRIKDAVCDAHRAVSGQRPSVDTRRPDVRIAAYVDPREAVFYLDTSGEPLFKRGYRRARQEAPLKENLAAGLVALSGWDPATEAFLDPMCGSGTIAVEAALIASGRAPGLGRRFGFEALRDFDAPAWDALQRAARTAPRPRLAATLAATDLDRNAIATLRETIAELGLDGVLAAGTADARAAMPALPQGVWLTNPPYGVRMGDRDELGILFRELGSVLKQRFAGWRCLFLTADTGLPGQLGLRESRRTPLFNGAIECRLFEFRMVSGRLEPARARGPGGGPGRAGGAGPAPGSAGDL